MCGRYVSTSSREELAEAYRVDEVRTDPLPERWNVAPTQPVYAVAARRPRDAAGSACRVLGAYHWGLVPSWAKDPSVGARMINARAENLAERPAYRTALARRRCVIPADAFWEWQDPAAGPGGRRRPKLPYAVRRPDGGLLSFAGIWEVWRDRADPEAPWLRSAAIVTTEAGGELRAIHDRMPVVLDAEAVEVWLDPAVEDPDRLLPLLDPPPGRHWETWPVSGRVNSVANEGPELLEPLPNATP